MPRSIWKGHISFGLVNIPVALYSAENRQETIRFHLIDRRDQARVKYERVNARTGEPVPWNEIVKGYEYEPDNYVLLTEQELKRSAPESTRTIEIETFVDQGAIDPVYFEQPYVVGPDKKGDKAYVLLREALRRSAKIGVARVVLHNKEHLAALMVRDDALVLNLLRFHDELRSLDEIDLPAAPAHPPKTAEKEIELAEQLVGAMTSEWKPEEFQDKYRDELKDWIDRKIAAGGKEVAEIPEPRHEKATVVNIMDLLKRSVEQTGGRAARTAPQTRPERAPRSQARHARSAARSKSGTTRRRARSA